MNKNIKALAEAKASKGDSDKKKPSSKHFLTSTSDFKDGHFKTGSDYYTKGRFQEYGEGSPRIVRFYRDSLYGGPKSPQTTWVERSRDKTPMRRIGGR